MLITPFPFFSVVSKEDWELSLPEGSLEVEKKPEELPNTPVNKVVKRSTGVNRITILYLYINRYSTGTLVGIYTFVSLVSHRSGRVEFRISNICFDFFKCTFQVYICITYYITSFSYLIFILVASDSKTVSSVTDVHTSETGSNPPVARCMI